MPIPPGIVAFFQLRKTVQRWEAEGLPIDRGGDAADLEPAGDCTTSGSTIKSKVMDSRDWREMSEMTRRRSRT